MNIYLDIDGVLLADRATPAYYADEFLQAVLAKYPDSTYWLTTHAWNGENVISHSLAPYLAADTQALLSRIKVADWGNDKTDGIDFSQPFLWFDDDLFDGERKALEQHNALTSQVRIDLAGNPRQLEEVTKQLFTNP